MSKFPVWFNRAYKRWSRSQPGEEDFLAFCDLLGYSPAKVLGWLQGESVPEGPEVLSVAGVIGIDVYSVLGLSKPDPDLFKIFGQFSHLHGEDRSRLALAILDAERYLQEYDISASSSTAKDVMKNIFEKYGLDK